MTADADIGHGFDFQRHDGGDPGTYVTVGEIMDPALPKLERDAREATHAQSTEGWREYIRGMLNAAEFSLTLHYNPGNAAMPLLMADLTATDQTPGNYKGVLPDGTEWDFAALVTGIGPSIPVDDKMEVEVTFQPTGKPTVTVAP